MWGSLTARSTRALDRLIGALGDPARADRTALAVLAGYVAVWSLYGVIAKSSQDLHYDMGEAVVWSHEALAGSTKHPPLSAWPVWLWFRIFPQTDGAYYVFSMAMAGIALWAAWKVSARFLTPEKRIAGLALLTLVPFYNFHALKYNANTVMLPLWALTTWAFVVAFQTRRAVPAALAGLAAAGAMLGKFWSVFLLAGLSIAALDDPRRNAFFRSPAPWITVAVGFVVLAPYLAVLYGNSTLLYALESHPGTPWTSLWSGLRYAVNALVYAALPALIALAASRPSRAAVADTIWPDDPDRRFAVVALIAPIVLPMVATVATTSLAASLWSMGGLTLLPAVLLSSPQVELSRAAVRRILGIAIAVPVIAVLISPVVAIAVHRQGVENYTNHYRLVAQAVEQAWRDSTPAPLRIFGSYNNLLYGSSFYFQNPPKTFEIVSPATTPWTTESDVARLGIAMVCPEIETVCMKALQEHTARARGSTTREAVTLSRTFLGMPGPLQRYVIVVVPPA